MPRILALDYGERRLGFAVSDPDGTIAMSLKVVEVVSDRHAIKEVLRTYEETGADKLVVGLPINMDGSKGPMAVKVEEFVESLDNVIGVRIDKWDERLSTSMADRTLLEADMSRKKRKRVRDKLAAQAMLQGYLDAKSCEHGDNAQV